ncbi:S8 family peptidase [Fibrobacter sp. UWH1]|uniref:S8 family peptidase n=1 Tax=Fibrobacter sp. UWH1 TaxID=1964354 RepID=UPI000B521FD3|nr:S8 family peptidase [Fibrobacter sp. UWH1]OWV14943.1 serine protease [Fibrobacter sp. UWH1]
MNDVLLLKGRFEQKSRPQGTPIRQLPSKAAVHGVLASHINDLIFQLKDVKAFWKDNTLIQNILIDVHYDRVIAKSNRVQSLFEKDCSDCIVGARFSPNSPKKHIITYCFARNSIDHAIDTLKKCEEIVSEQYDGEIFKQHVEEINTQKINFKDIARSRFVSSIVDCYYIEKFAIRRVPVDVKDRTIISLYQTNEDTIDLLKKIKINITEDQILDGTTLLLNPSDIQKINNNAPYLIAMAVSDLAKFTKNDFITEEKKKRTIKLPQNEPVIGVIDTLFDTNVYFSNWVEFENRFSPVIPISRKDFEHGTQVSSIIVDGPSLNPKLDDGCGHFRVKHFGVMGENKGSTFTILKTIRDIVSENRQIKVWNLSLGTIQEVLEDYISPEAAVLDKIQSEYDVTFVIAGTNKQTSDKNGPKRIGAPADSINSIVVNSVNLDKKPSSYTRCGPVLSFFNKPDFSYYGGDYKQRLIAYGPEGENGVYGTSFAAPWISRKLAYLIHILGLKREVAKALLIDSAAGWMKKENPSEEIGFGIIPIKINDIVQSKDDEIRFILMGVSEKFDTYNYNIPVPVANSMHPFAARATLCYFPKCDRNQGVDYTNTEISMQFGRMKEKNIKSINGNAQDVDDPAIYKDLSEESVRADYRKWDNVKYVAEKGFGSLRPHDAYGDDGLWGVSLKTKNRLNPQDGANLHFGIVVTLKEIYGQNRLDEFKQRCLMRGWLVNHVNIENLVEVRNKAEEDIVWE